MADSGSATVEVGRHASLGFHLRNKAANVAVAVKLQAIDDSPIELAQGYAIFRDVRAAGSHLLERVYADGLEDFFTLTGPPERSTLDYQVELSEGVHGLRLVADTLEFLDSGGAPRLRVSPPFVVDANGDARPAHIALGGCRFDADPSAPWGRPVVAPGAQECRVSISWDSRDLAYPAIVDPSWIATGSMAQARSSHTAETLFTGQVLVAGGFTGSTPLASAELYDPSTGTWAATGTMSFGRWAHTSNRLASGDVVVAGGFSNFATVEVYRPFTGVWERKADLSTGREGHASVVLGDGRILLTGGLNSAFSYLTSGEIFDPRANTWTTTSNMTTPRLGHTLSLLPGGSVVAIGGSNASGVYTAAVEIFSPTTGAWTPIASMLAARAFHSASAVREGKILVVGGYGSGGFLGSAEIFTPGTQSWASSTTTLVPRNSHTASRLPNGDILIAGGVNSTGSLGSSYRYLSAATSSPFWQQAATLQVSRKGHTASLLQSGNVLVAGGESGSQYFSSSELFTEAGPNDFCTGGGYIRGTAGSAPASVNLSSQGTGGWAHWGLPTISSYNHNSFEAPFIGPLTLVSGSLNTATSGGPSFSWSKGTPTASATTAFGVAATGGLGAEVSFTAPADLTPTKLRLYVGATQPSTLRLSLPGTSCGSVVIPITGTNVEVKLEYAGTANGQSLVASMKTNCSPAAACPTTLYLRAATMERVALRSLINLTGQDPDSANDSQSESSMAVSSMPNQGIVVAYNDAINDGPTIVNTAEHRQIYRGASLMGWSWAARPEGPWTHGRVPTPAGWPVLWGDPATTASRLRPNVMYLSNLAISEDRFDEKKEINTEFLLDSVGGKLDGACIAKSTNFGRTFETPTCYSNQGHFWDGGTMESGLSPDGPAYVAYWDTNTSQIDVLQAPNDDSPFALISTPFPGRSISTHPRLRYDVTRRRLYVAAVDNTGKLLANFWDEQRQPTPGWSSAVEVASGVWNNMTSVVHFGGHQMRIGVTFGFDVSRFALANDGARFFFVQNIDGAFKIRGTICNQNLEGCAAAPWATDRAGEEAFQPVVRNSVKPGQTFVSWYARAGNFIYRDRLYIGPKAASGQYAAAIVHDDRSGQRFPCTATKSHYWSDYEDAQLVDGTWLETVTTSEPGCTQEFAFNSKPVHINLTQTLGFNHWAFDPLGF